MRGYRSATKTAAVATAAIAATIASAIASTTTATMAAAPAGQAVDAGAGRVRLAAGAHGLAVGQVQACKLRGLQRIDVAWQLITIVFVTLLTTALSAPVGATAFTTTFRTWAAWCGTTLAIATVVKTHVAARLLAAWTVIPADITAHVALAFKTGSALWTVAA
jgi:hypothetical protein